MDESQKCSSPSSVVPIYFSGRFGIDYASYSPQMVVATEEDYLHYDVHSCRISYIDHWVKAVLEGVICRIAPKF